jgi:chromosome segregation ATPase
MSQVKQKKNKGQDKTYNHGYCTRRSLLKQCESCKGNEERAKNLQNALKEVLEQNDALRSRVAELEALISEAEDNIDQKQKLIQELYTKL